MNLIEHISDIIVFLLYNYPSLFEFCFFQLLNIVCTSLSLKITQVMHKRYISSLFSNKYQENLFP